MDVLTWLMSLIWPGESHSGTAAWETERERENYLCFKCTAKLINITHLHQSPLGE